MKTDVREDEAVADMPAVEKPAKHSATYYQLVATTLVRAMEPDGPGAWRITHARLSDVDPGMTVQDFIREYKAPDFPAKEAGA